MIFKASLLHSILIKQHLVKSRHSMMAVPLQPETQGKIFCILCGSLYIGKCITGDMLVTFHKFMKKAALNPNFMLALGMDDANVNLLFKNRSGYFCQLQLLKLPIFNKPKGKLDNVHMCLHDVGKYENFSMRNFLTIVCIFFKQGLSNLYVHVSLLVFKSFGSGAGVNQP